MNIAAKPLLFGAVLLISGCSGCGKNNPEEVANEWCRLNDQINTTSDPVEHEKLIESIRDLELETRIRFGEDKTAMEKIYTITQACDEEELD